MSVKLWDPPAELVERATITRYASWLAAERGVQLGAGGLGPGEDGYAALWRWSVDDLEAFWGSVWDFFAVGPRPETVLGDRSMPGAEWFPGAELNYAEVAFRGKADRALAIVAASEDADAPPREITWGELRRDVARLAAGLRARGIGPGDRVAGYLPNVPEAVAGFLACASLGAAWSCCSPDFGARSVVDRFAQIEPKLLLAVDGYRYGGRAFDRTELVERIAAEIGAPIAWLGLLDGTGWEDGLLGPPDAELTFAPVPFDHPLWVLYSSGTTGLPKAIVQGQGGILLEHLKWLHLHADLQAGDRFFWFTTTGWMMWNLLVSGLLTDAAIVLYDGNPAHPTPARLWDLAADTRITTFGTSASYLASCMKQGVEPAGGGRDLRALRAVGSTGSPLAPEGFEWVYERLGAETWLFSTSGGTDVCSAFVGGVPTLPVHRGELQARALGAKLEAWDEHGRPLVGEVGELVVTEPLPSMPLYLWGDDDGSRYHDAYFDVYPGVWRHGDWIEVTDRGTAIISGRSDSTINRGGVRMGSAEIYRAVLAVDAVLDALVVDVDGWLPLFVVLREGAALDDALVGAIRTRVREDCSPRHVPSEVIAVAEIPRTLSGKVLEIPVKRILAGADPTAVASLDSLANPKALEPFAALARDRRG